MLCDVMCGCDEICFPHVGFDMVYNKVMLYGDAI